MGRKVLIVEKDKKIGDELQDYLIINDFEVIYTTSLSEAVKACKPKSLDAVIVDTDTLEEETFKFIASVRAKKVIPAIVLSSKGAITDIVMSMRSGIDDYMVKPINYSEFVARVRAHIESFDALIAMLGKKDDVIERNGLKIDKRTHKVYVDDIEVTLGRREYNILELLIDNPGIVYSKEELYRKIWGMESVGNISTVTVHIRKLREKIEEGTRTERFIETIWGVGYRFKV